MYIENSRTANKKKFKRSITDKLRKKGKWNHIKCSIKTKKKAQKEQKSNTGTKKKDNTETTVMDIVDINPANQ